MSEQADQFDEQQPADTLPGHGSGETGEGGTGGGQDHPDRSETGDQAQQPGQGEVEREGDLGNESGPPAEGQQAP